MGQFDYVEPLRPGRSVFDLSYDKKMTADMAMLIPIVCEEMVPGDRFQLSHEVVCRMQPLLAPILHEINIFTHTFFVPYRILWDKWEQWITGGPDGDYDEGGDPIPEWIPTANGVKKGTLWDYLGLPVDVAPQGAYPIDFPRIAYNRIWNEYYRDQNLQDEVLESNEDILYRSYEKDYFTSALPFQQRGQAPAIPLSGNLPVDGIGLSITGSWDNGTVTVYQADGTTPAYTKYVPTSKTNNMFVKGGSGNYPDLTVDGSAIETFNVSDLRTAVQIQKWLERNARGGVRYTEFLKMHFGESVRDDRLQRPEYVGGTKMPLIISEVLQTYGSAASDEPLGQLGGHGITAGYQYSGQIHAKEYGLVMTLMSIMPKPGYQQGINRQWLRKTRYDFYFPEFAHLSEQAILQAELYVTTNDSAKNTQIFGYQGRYDEMRVKHNMVCGDMRDLFNYWHLSREFDTMPTLGGPFLQVNNEDVKRIFAVPAEPGFILNVGNKIKAVRPMPNIATPGLMDHF